MTYPPHKRSNTVSSPCSNSKQWQEDSLAAATSNKAEEGADATYGTHTPPTTLGNFCQISTKSVNISRTLDIVRKYGRKSEVAYAIMKRGKELFTMFMNGLRAPVMAY